MNLKPWGLAVLTVALSSLRVIRCSITLGTPALVIPAEAFEGDIIDFYCSLPLRHNETILITFLKQEDNRKYGQSTILPSERKAKITIRAERSSTGSVVCKAEAQHNTEVVPSFSSKVYFTVFEPIHNVSLTLSPAVVFEADDITLTCNVAGGKPVVYLWTLDGKRLEASSHRLRIKGVTQKDVGSYSCTARSSVAMDNSTTSNNVTVSLKEMVSTPEIKFTVHKSGGQYIMNITCQASSGSLPANFTLRYYNQTEEMSQTQIVVDSLKAYFSRPIILGQSTLRAQCLAENGRSVRQSNSIPVEVVPVGGTVSQNLEYDISHNFELEGVTLQCAVERGSHPSYRWYLNDSPLPTKVFYKMSNGGRSLTILLDQGSGLYHCEATDSFDPIVNISSSKLAIDWDVLKNHIPTEVVALVLGCSLFLTVLLIGCCIYGAKNSQRQPTEEPGLITPDTEAEIREDRDELRQEDYEEDLDLVAVTTMAEVDEVDMESLKEWIAMK